MSTKLCNTCFRTLDKSKFPIMGKSNKCRECKFGKVTPQKERKTRKQAKPPNVASKLGEGWDW